MRKPRANKLMKEMKEIDRMTLEELISEYETYQVEHRSYNYENNRIRYVKSRIVQLKRKQKLRENRGSYYREEEL